MPDPQWTAVDDYVTDLVVRPSRPRAPWRRRPRPECRPLPSRRPRASCSPCWPGSRGATRILELGTLGGYSTIWLARALPAGGRLISLEVNPRHAEVARANLTAAGVDAVAEVRVGAALDSLSELVEEGAGPFDLIFIDADKPNIPEYLNWSIKLSRPGTVLVIDNVVRDGGLLDASGTRPEVVGVRRLHEQLADDDRILATTIQTVGAKGYDGFTLAVVNSV